MDAPSARWPLKGNPVTRWRDGRDLERTRHQWARKFLGANDAVKAEATRATREELPSALHVEPKDSLHGSTQEKLRHDWLAAKACALLMPADPISAGFGVLRAVEEDSGELRAQVDPVRAKAQDRAPNGSSWFDWAMTNPGSGMTENEAKNRDMSRGYYEALVEHIDEGISSFRRARAKARALSLAVHLVPLAALAAVVGVGESLLPIDAWWAVALAALFTFLVVDYFVVTRVAEPLIESQRRRILDKAADGMAWQLGVGAIGAALSREEARSEQGTAS